MGETEFKDASREVQRQYEEAKKRVEDACPHVKGSLGPTTAYGAQSIAWHLYEDGILRGVCQECLKVFEPGKPGYKEAVIDLHAGGYRISNLVSTCGVEHKVTKDDDVPMELAKQFVDTRWEPFPEESLKDFIKRELLEKFCDELFQEYLKVLKS